MGEVPAREVLWNVPVHWVIYPCFLLALACAVFFFVRRWRLWKLGVPEYGWDAPGRLLAGMLRVAL